LKSRWKRTGNDIVSQISLEMLKREILELVEVFKNKSKNNEVKKDVIKNVENDLVRLSNLLLKISKKTENERRKYSNAYSNEIEELLMRIYSGLDLTY